MKYYKIMSNDSSFFNKKGDVQINLNKAPKHYPSASSEWRNSVYTYNNLSRNDTFGKDTIVGNITKSFFNYYYVLKKGKSLRMRTMLRRLTTKRLFISNPNIKQTSDKATITLYIFDRESTFFKRKLFFLLKQFNKLTGVSTIPNIRTNRKKIKQSVWKFYKTTSITDIRKYRSYNTFLVNLNKQKKSSFIYWFSHYLFFKWALLIFNIKVNIETIKVTDVYKRYANGYKLIIKKRGDNGNYQIVRFIKLHKFTEKQLKIIVLMLHKLLLYTIEKNKTNNVHMKKFLLYLQKEHLKANDAYASKDRFKWLTKNLFRLEILVSKYIRKVYTDNYFKFDYLLPFLKTSLSKIYSKKIELNLVKLKYLFLNSDIISEAIATKLRRKKSRILAVIGKSLKTVKLPVIETSNIILGNNDKKNVNKIYENETNVNNKVANTYAQTNIVDLFNTIKYKWVTGIKVEGKGRLTRRFTASRALYKYKHKGNLRNMEFTNYISNKKSNNVFMVRNEHKPNIQYTFTNSKKRIGAFGIKTWLSSN